MRGIRIPSLSASAEPQCRSGRRSEEPPSKQRLHRRRHRRRSKRRQKAFWPVWSNRNVGRLFLPNGWNVPALHYPDRTSRNGIRKSAWHENNVSVKKLKRDVMWGRAARSRAPVRDSAYRLANQLQNAESGRMLNSEIDSKSSGEHWIRYDT